jgi:F0F1-type ATP synthase assembly protein I
LEGKSRKYFRLVRSSDSKVLRELAPFLIMGWQIVLTVVFCGFIGWWLDKQFKTVPWLMISMLFFGAAAAMVNFLKAVANLDKKKKDKVQDSLK